MKPTPVYSSPSRPPMCVVNIDAPHPITTFEAVLAATVSMQRQGYDLSRWRFLSSSLETPHKAHVYFYESNPTHPHVIGGKP